MKSVLNFLAIVLIYMHIALIFIFSTCITSITIRVILSLAITLLQCLLLNQIYKKSSKLKRIYIILFSSIQIISLYFIIANFNFFEIKLSLLLAISGIVLYIKTLKRDKLFT